MGKCDEAVSRRWYSLFLFLPKFPHICTSKLLRMDTGYSFLAKWYSKCSKTFKNDKKHICSITGNLRVFYVILTVFYGLFTHIYGSFTDYGFFTGQINMKTKFFTCVLFFEFSHHNPIFSYEKYLF